MTMTELLPSIRQLTSVEKFSLIRILTEELNPQGDMFPFQPNKVYYLPTPYHSFEAGRALMAAMEQESES